MSEEQAAPDVPLVRPARGSDLRRLADIENAGLGLYVEALGEEAVGEALRSPAPSGSQRASVPGFLLVIDKPAVGFAHVIHLDGHAHLEQVAVLPGAMRHGYGTALVRAAMREAERDGFTALSLCTYADLPWNAPFYERLGFEAVTDLLPFQRRLRDYETSIGLDEAGRRVVMTVSLTPEHPRPDGVLVEPETVDPFAVVPVAASPETAEVTDLTVPPSTAP